MMIKMPENKNAIENIPRLESDNCTLTKRGYHTPIEPIFFSPTYCGHYICKKEFRIDRRLGGTYLLLATVSGSGILEYEGGNYAVPTGSVMLIDCRRHHCYYAASDGWEFFYAHYDGGMSRQYFEYLAPALPVIKLPPHIFVDVSEKLGQMLESCDKPSAGNDEVLLSGMIYSILVNLISVSDLPDGSPSSLTNAITDAAAYINSHLDDAGLDVSMLAKRAYLSRPYFSTGFKRVMGISPHDYITLRRINRAKRLLVETALPVTSIAAEIGTDASSFSRLFSKNVGMTPIEYRKLMR